MKFKLIFKSQNSSHINADTFVACNNVQNLNSTELKQPDTEQTNTGNFKCNRINEQQNLNSTLIMNDNATSSGTSSDENLNNLVQEDVENQKEELINKENVPVVKTVKSENVILGIPGSKVNHIQTCNFDQLNLEKIKPRSFSNNSNSSSDSDFY